LWYAFGLRRKALYINVLFSYEGFKNSLRRRLQCFSIVEARFLQVEVTHYAAHHLRADLASVPPGEYRLPLGLMSSRRQARQAAELWAYSSVVPPASIPAS
jgi:hypothetical protein